MTRFYSVNIAKSVIRALLIVAPVAAIIGFNLRASAAQITSRLILVGTSVPSATTTHAFSFSLATPGALGSMEFEYCSNDPFVGAPCTAPVGLDLTGANLSGESGETGFSVDAVNSTANRLVITRASVAATPQTVTYTFDNVVNPSMSKQTVYVRISTFATTDATGPRTDDGSVAFSTAGGMGVGGYVPPYLIMCAGLAVSSNCSSVTGGLVDIGELSRAQPKANTSQFAVATNDPTGYSAYILGSTLTAGNNIIPALAAPTSSANGTSQFGINLRDNSAPDVGNDPIGAGTGAVSADYANPNLYKFAPGDMIARSVLPTEFNVFTVTYLANISSSQPMGVYTATMTYLATAAF